MSHLYPRERVERVLRPLSSLNVHRILLKSFAIDPLAVRASPSRFCGGKSFAVLYAAEDFSTVFIEVVVRDRFVHEEDRFVGFDEVEVRASIEFKLKGATAQSCRFERHRRPRLGRSHGCGARPKPRCRPRTRQSVVRPARRPRRNLVLLAPHRRILRRPL